MPTPSTLLLVAARPCALYRAFPASYCFTSSYAALINRRPIVLTALSSSYGFSRQYSTPAASDGVNLLDQAPSLNDAFVLPPPPSAPLPVDPAAVPTLAELGLGSYWPSGLVQQGLDALHSLGLPWWSCIVVGAVVIRGMMVPLFAAVQRNSVNMLNHAPEIQQFQMRTMAAHGAGDRLGVIRILKEQKQYFRENDINHFRQFQLMTAQCLVFCSMFLGVKGMATLPVESFKTEGLLHIVDLTTRDPFFILPTITMSTLALTLHLGAEGVSTQDFPPWLKRMFWVVPIVAFFPVAYFPSAMALYWVTSNLISLGQYFLFRSAFGKNFFRIPDRRVMPQGYGMGLDKQTFAEQFAKMAEAAQEAAHTQAKIQSMQLPDDRQKWEGLKTNPIIDDKRYETTPPSLKPEEVAARHKEIKEMIKEINTMKKKVEALKPDVPKTDKKDKPPDIHIKIDKDKME